MKKLGYSESNGVFAPLAGGNLVRLAYLDEAGVSNPEHEPIMTVAGVVVHGDRQYKAIEAHLDKLIAKHVPDHPPGFSFHAYQLFGGEKFFDKKKWPLNKRLEILDDLAAIPAQYDLPIFHCSMDRAEVAKNVSAETAASHDQLEMTIHAHGFFFCALQIETLLRATTGNEVAMLIAEDRDQVRKMLKLSHTIFRGRGDPKMFAQFIETVAEYKKLLPFERVIETVQFAQKTESSLLQIADVCAFAIKRHVMKKPHSARLHDAIKGQFILGPTNQIGFGPLVQGGVSSEQPA